MPYLKEIDLERVKEWYNGYNFLGERVYNPFDILKFIKNGFVFRNYWWESGSPYSLMELIKTKEYYLPSLQNLKTDETLLSSFDIENIQLESLLFQAGYLTIDRVEDDGFDIAYLLKVPNMEVQVSLNRLMLDHLTNSNDITTLKKIRNTLLEANLEAFKETLISLFASIPYNNYVKNTISNYEGYYASVVYAYLASLGLEIIAEDVTNRGRIDITLLIKDTIYIIEFKVGQEDALAQIKEKNYHQKYINQNKEIYLVGINFDEESRNISDFGYEKYGTGGFSPE
jgi:Holliday junction resolvase-like predicted endonuclease